MKGQGWLRDGDMDGDAVELPPSSECLAEMRVRDRKAHGLLTSSNTSGLGEVLTCKRFSSLSHLFSVTKIL